VVEMKFDDGDTEQSKEQIKAYKRIFGVDKVVVMEKGVDCICEDDDGEKEPVAEPVPEPTINWWLAGGAVVLGIATVVAAVIPFDGPVGEAVLGSATAATWTAAFAN